MRALQIAEWLSFRHTALRPLMDARLAELNNALAGKLRQHRAGAPGLVSCTAIAPATRVACIGCDQAATRRAAASPRALQVSPTLPAACGPRWQTLCCMPPSHLLRWPSQWHSTATSATCCAGERLWRRAAQSLPCHPTCYRRSLSFSSHTLHTTLLLADAPPCTEPGCAVKGCACCPARRLLCRRNPLKCLPLK